MTISKDGREVKAISVLSVLTLDCHQGDEITVTVEGEDEAAIFEAHAEFAADPELLNLATASIEDGASAERASTSAFGTGSSRSCRGGRCWSRSPTSAP